MKDFEPEAFAREWIAAWNRSDVEAVLVHYTDDAMFVSPLAATITGNSEACGKETLRAYWNKALHVRSSPPQFRLESFVWDQDKRALLIVYVSSEPDSCARKCELMHFHRSGLIGRGEAFAAQ